MRPGLTLLIPYGSVPTCGPIRSASYSGSVRATATRPFGAGAAAVGDLHVEGAVLRQPALARQVAADASGRVEETLTSGTTVWMRTAASADALDSAPWQVRPGSPAAAGTLDMPLLARRITTAGVPRGEAADFAGRRVIRATLLSRGDGEGNLLPLAGADVLLSLDEAGSIGHVVVTWPARDPQLVVEVEISGHNHPQDIAPPDRGPAALRRTVPVEALRPRIFGRWSWVDCPRDGGSPALGSTWRQRREATARCSTWCTSTWCMATPTQDSGTTSG